MSCRQIPASAGDGEGWTLRFQRQVPNCGANGAILGRGGMGREGGVRSLRLEVARALKGCTSSAPRGAKPSKTGRRDRAAMAHC